MYILSASAGAAADVGGVSLFSPLVLCVVMLVAMYFLMIRPENKKKKAAAEMRSSLKVGDVITTIGGVVGTICAVKEQTIVMETGADRVRVEFTKWAISSKGTQSTEDKAIQRGRYAQKAAQKWSNHAAE